MPNILRNLQILSVDTVDKGAGDRCTIVFRKRDPYAALRKACTVAASKALQKALPIMVTFKPALTAVEQQSVTTTARGHARARQHQALAESGSITDDDETGENAMAKLSEIRKAAADLNAEVAALMKSERITKSAAYDKAIAEMRLERPHEYELVKAASVADTFA